MGLPIFLQRGYGRYAGRLSHLKEAAIIKLSAKFRWERAKEDNSWGNEYSWGKSEDFKKDASTRSEDSEYNGVWQPEDAPAYLEGPGPYVNWELATIPIDVNDPAYMGDLCKWEAFYVGRLLHWVQRVLTDLPEVLALDGEDLCDQPMSLDPVRDRLSHAYIKVYESIKDWSPHTCEPVGCRELAALIRNKKRAINMRRNVLTHEYGVNPGWSKWNPILEDIEDDWPAWRDMIRDYLHRIEVKWEEARQSKGRSGWM